MTLSDLERAMLGLEGEWFRLPGAKEQAILTRTGMTATAYYARLNRLIDIAGALEHDPMTVNRLRRLRERRARMRRAS